MAKGGGRGKRSYVRDARGRFASTPGGGAAKKAAKGRSASAGRPQPRTFRQRQQASLDRRPGQGGYLGKATREAKAKLRASKAKLKASATPQQRAAVTRARIRAEGASPVTRMRRTAPTGVLKGVKVTRAQGRRAKPGQVQPVAPVKPQQQGSTFARMATIGRKRVRLTGRLINMNAREPYQFTPPPKNLDSPYSDRNRLKGGSKAQQKDQNLQAAVSWLTGRGNNVEIIKKKGSRGQGQVVAQAVTIPGGFRTNSQGQRELVKPKSYISLNRYASAWTNPARSAIEQRRTGWTSTSASTHVLLHEEGHTKDKLAAIPTFMRYWPASRGTPVQSLAGRVSRYATTSFGEFIAEAYAGLRTGRKYDREVMAAYREAMGLPAKPPARMRSRLPRRRKPAP